MENDVVKFSLLENGLEFILSSIHHLNGTSSNKYAIKHSILNLSSGVELLFKYRLLKKDWKFVFQKSDKADLALFEVGDFQSVNSKTSIERLINECGIKFSEEELETLKSLREKRNRLEHFSITDSLGALKVYFIKVLSLVVDFILNNFDMEELTCTEDRLLDDVRGELGELKAYIDHRFSEIKDELQEYGKYNSVVSCPSCYQEALVTDAGSKCLFCGYKYGSDKVAKDYIEHVLGISEYESVTKGGDFPKYMCPECGGGLIFDEEREIWKCFNCGLEDEKEGMQYCNSCGQPYQVFDVEEDCGMCDDCLEYEFNKE